MPSFCAKRPAKEECYIEKIYIFLLELQLSAPEKKGNSYVAQAPFIECMIQKKLIKKKKLPSGGGGGRDRFLFPFLKQPYARSPTLSCRTEFTDPDSRGRSAQRPSSRAKGLAGLMARKFKKKSRTVGQPGQPLARKRRPSGSINGNGRLNLLYALGNLLVG